MLDDLKIAIVYDWIDKWGGVERVLLNLVEMFPKADFYTSYYDPKRAGWAKNIKIHTSFIQNFPKFIKNNRALSIPLYPFAFESFNFNNYDLVISVTSSFAKSFITKPNTLHICYLLTPTRFLWLYPEKYYNSLTGKLLSRYIKYLKNWDYISANRPDKIISISKTVSERCKKYYDRESDVIYPPFDIVYWSNLKAQILKLKTTTQNLKFKANSPFSILNSQFFLVVSRLEPYKNVELTIKAFNQHPNLNLVIVGDGTQEKKLKAMANKNIQFLSNVTDTELGLLYQRAQALITPQIEDFGYVAIESQFFNCPIIYYNYGGITELVKDGVTGIGFNKQTVSSLYQAIERFQSIAYNLKASTIKFGADNVKRFSKNKFEKYFSDFIMSVIARPEGTSDVPKGRGNLNNIIL